MSTPRRVVPDYYRREHLDFFARYRSPFYAVSFDLDVTAFKADLDRRGLPIYLNLTWAMTGALTCASALLKLYLTAAVSSGDSNGINDEKAPPAVERVR